jgi:hypothetical protein
MKKDRIFIAMKEGMNYGLCHLWIDIHPSVDKWVKQLYFIAEN